VRVGVPYILWTMFVRTKKNRSGTTSVHIVEKRAGVYTLVKAIGSSRNPDDIERLVQKARDELHPSLYNQPPLFATQAPSDAAVKTFVEQMKNSDIHTVGPELIFGTLFDRIGFNAIPHELFRHLVIARLAYPVSKLKTVDYLYRSQGVSVHEDAIYRFLDTLTKRHKKTAERIAFEHTKKTLKILSVVFYDMTTLYFEAEDEDDLRKIGFSKDGKFQCPQIMIGLLVGEGGLPIGYDLFEGNTFEGHTLIKTLAKIEEKYQLGKPVVVADAAMLSKKNLEGLTTAAYTFIVGGRVKNESEKTKVEILEKARGITDGTSFEVKREDGTRLIVSFSEKRRKKDAKNREKGVKKLRAKVATGRLTKTSITNRGYNKFLALDGEVQVTIDEAKISDDAKWDGLKGYVTNTKLEHKKVIEQYGHLWQIEKAFRISKTDLRVRPIFHYRRRRIEAHLTIAFVAYAIWKELEMRLSKAGLSMSPKYAGELTHYMYALRYSLPQSKLMETKILTMDDEQKAIYEVIHRM